MKVRFTVVLLLFILFPTILVAILTSRLVQGELGQVDRAFDALLVSKLKQMDSQIQHFLEKRREELRETTSSPKIKELFQSDGQIQIPYVDQLFLRLSEEIVFFSNPGKVRIATDSAFFQKNVEIFSRQVFSEMAQIASSPDSLGTSPNYSLSFNKNNQVVRTHSSFFRNRVHHPSTTSGPIAGEAYTGWLPWSEGMQSHLLFWHWRADGLLVGAELSIAQLVKDLTQVFSEDPLSDLPFSTGCITLCNNRNQKLRRWGAYVPDHREIPRTILILREPLQDWNLQYHTPVETMVENIHSGVYFNLILVFLLCMLVLVGLGLLVYRESTREMRDALQKVSFVNQVSHELKSPLTNIRMFVELLQMQLDEEFAEEHDHLKIVISELHRLSRLIHNVLTFAGSQKNELVSNPQPVVPDGIILETIDTFKPLFESKRFHLSCDLNAKSLVRLDRDVFEQILGNLFSNVEKYAFCGKFIGVKSRFSGSETKVWVFDEGPGIPEGKEEQIFKPFWRVQDTLSEGASGTGIGLTISRNLAEINGGSLKLVWNKGKLLEDNPDGPAFSGSNGACFLVVINSEPKEEKRDEDPGC